ncbi:protoheme IX farnesyltransferase, partial [Burkholderia multivorans]
MSELRQTPDTQSERPLQRTIDEARHSKRPRSIIGAYIALTKPRVIELLLVTTAPVMFLAARGMPDLWLVLNTLIGGAAEAPSASAFNSYLDPEIDLKVDWTKDP